MGTTLPARDGAGTEKSETSDVIRRRLPTESQPPDQAQQPGGYGPMSESHLIRECDRRPTVNRNDWLTAGGHGKSLNVLPVGRGTACPERQRELTFGGFDQALSCGSQRRRSVGGTTAAWVADMGKPASEPIFLPRQWCSGTPVGSGGTEGQISFAPSRVIRHQLRQRLARQIEHLDVWSSPSN